MDLRPEQEQIANYAGGRAAVSAVPGSGKTYTLAALAARLLSRGLLPDEAEVLVVTFTNSAVDNIRNRIRAVLKEEGLIDTGYRVLTLHGLANTIVRERPDLAGTTADFRIDDELSGPRAIAEAARWFTQQQPDLWRSFLPSDLTSQQRNAAEEQWRDATVRIGDEVTRLAKNLRLTPARLRELMASLSPISPFLRMGLAIYERYEQILNLGGRLDFDDLIWRAIMALENDADFRRRLGQRWPYILEDEAQDSTPLQEQILGMLARDHNNWVRVGDPNQAIMTTFTASDVRFFREFLQRDDVIGLPLSVSGRSAPKIIDLANRLADWAATEHPDEEVRAGALSNRVRILPTGPGDRQQNPPDEQAVIHVQRFSSEDDEAKGVAKSAARYILQHPAHTCAVLAPTNWFGGRIVEELSVLQAAHPERELFQDQLKNSQPVRGVARMLAQAVRFCGVPTNTNALADLRTALVSLGAGSDQGVAPERMRTLVRSAKPERLLFPSPAAEPALPASVPLGLREQQELEALGVRVSKWLRASMLPIDQLILVIAQDVLTKESDLAIAHSLALSLRRLAALNPQLQLADLARELDDIYMNRLKFMSNALLESGFEPQAGVVTVTTMHKAKGLEWERVYLTCVDQLEFPHNAEGQFRGELWFLRGHDPSTEARKQLEALAGGGHIPGDIELLRQARVEYISERLRLLYVGVTRAKRDLIISYSRERRERANELALAVSAIA
ncbi:MAG: ATP-dependent helicase [Chloroflexi bacterium]|nr:ATP-dependent helicase [Chloroflexota bacterium]